MIESDELAIALGRSTATGRTRARSPRGQPVDAREAAASYVIAGHSERRQLFGEDDEMVNKKVLAILAAGMTPILCCGETLEEREAGAPSERVRSQVRAGLAGRAGPSRWPASSSPTSRSGPSARAHRHARGRPGDVRHGAPGGGRGRRRRRGSRRARAVRGSVKPSNAGELLSQPDIDGALVGGASLDPDDFARIIQSIPAQ
jgi:triosephosphate isomerase